MPELWNKVRGKGPINLAGVEGVEPANAGIKIQCLNQLGDTPTRVKNCCQSAFWRVSLQQSTHQSFLEKYPESGILPTGQRMFLQIFAFIYDPVAWGYWNH